MSQTVTLKGNPQELAGSLPSVGDQAPAFTLRGTDMKPKSLSDYAGKVKIISVVPSLDTPTCQVQTKHFNQDAADLGADVVVLTVSVDLPMAQKRWCAAEGIEQVECLSDYHDHSFGRDYGVRMVGPGLLARAVLVVDRDDVVKYVQLVPEVADEPDYEPVLAAARALA